jgi:indolepyruvate ferredoxin oxidoreductase
VLAALRGLRGTALDVFGYSAERRMERRLIAEYEADLDLIEKHLAPASADAAAALASVPALIRGYGHVKAGNAAKAEGERTRLIDRLVALPAKPALQAAE